MFTVVNIYKQFIVGGSQFLRTDVLQSLSSLPCQFCVSYGALMHIGALKCNIFRKLLKKAKFIKKLFA